MMDPWIGENEEVVRRKCDELLANDPGFTEFLLEHDVYGFSDEEWRIIAEAIKRNTTIEELRIESDFDRVLGVSATRSIAAALLVHPKLEELEFMSTPFAEFNAIALALSQNERIMRLRLKYCVVTPRVMENISFLVKENALETLVLYESVDEDGNLVQIDLGALGNNQSLRELTISFEGAMVDEAAMTAPTLEGIARLLKVNQRLQKLEVDLQGSRATQTRSP